MGVGLDIDHLLRSFRADGDRIAARMLKGDDGRPILQMRVTMGVLQMELEGRPDGHRPGGAATILDCLKGRLDRDSGTIFTHDDWSEIDRELSQFYHRRVCLLAVGSVSQGQGRLDRAIDCFARAARDAEHSLALMDFIEENGSESEYVATHETYRPFVLFHRTLARVQGCILKKRYEDAIDLTKDGLRAILDVAGELVELEESDAEEVGDEETSAEDTIEGLDGAADEDVVAEVDSASDEFGGEEDDATGTIAWIQQLEALIEQIRSQHGIDRTLREQIEDAVESEDYELAARLRRQLEARDATAPQGD